MRTFWKILISFEIDAAFTRADKFHVFHSSTNFAISEVHNTIMAWTLLSAAKYRANYWSNLLKLFTFLWRKKWWYRFNGRGISILSQRRILGWKVSKLFMIVRCTLTIDRVGGNRAVHAQVQKSAALNFEIEHVILILNGSRKGRKKETVCASLFIKILMKLQLQLNGNIWIDMSSFVMHIPAIFILHFNNRIAIYGEIQFQIEFW